MPAIEPIAWLGVVEATDTDHALGSAPRNDLLSIVELSRSTAEITSSYGWLRSTSKHLVADIREGHNLAFSGQCRILSSQLAGKGAQDLLEELGDLGFSWRDIAKMVGVSVPALTKWRKTGGASGPNVKKLADLLAACRLIMDEYPNMKAIASWFEVPLDPGAPITPIDLWATENYHLVFELASGHLDPLDALDDFDPDWRSRYQSSFEVFQAGDGELSIRAKSR